MMISPHLDSRKENPSLLPRRLGGVGASNKDLSLSVELSNFSEVDTCCSTATLSDLSELACSDFRQRLTDDCCSTAASSLIDCADDSVRRSAPSPCPGRLPVRPEPIGGENSEQKSSNPSSHPLGRDTVSAGNSPIKASQRSRRRQAARLTQYGYVDSDQQLCLQSADIGSIVGIPDEDLLNIAARRPTRLLAQRHRRSQPERSHSTS